MPRVAQMNDKPFARGRLTFAAPDLLAGREGFGFDFEIREAGEGRRDEGGARALTCLQSCRWAVRIGAPVGGRLWARAALLSGP
jgi:hypothetical protein